MISGLPTRWSIFLPTERFDPNERLAAVKRVDKIYRTRLDAVYRPKLRALREKYAGQERCFIIGNGPSLNRTDLSVLKDEVTFAVNGFFLKARDLDWLPTFYVVEDQLVAEDRRQEIDAFKGSQKLFPVYLGYCFEEADDTIFFNHLPRKSFPYGFDFSMEADEVTYAGCTVTFTCMQLAYYLGFKEIYLIGVDASYQLPKDVSQSSDHGVAVLDMKSDDPNHFHPDYFGKGFRWHDPQVDQMLEAYGVARSVSDEGSQHIYNATVGGQLEVFERRSFQDLFPQARTPEQLDLLAPSPAPAAAESDLPRVLVFDLTAPGGGTATGELKASIMADWPADRYLQVYSRGRGKIGVAELGGTIRKQPVTPAELAALVDNFDPELILYRPVPDAPALHQAAMTVIRERPAVPLATWIMDDWHSRIRTEDPGQFVTLDADWTWLLERSAVRLSIGEAMSNAFQQRFGVVFEPFANGVDPRDWPGPHQRVEGPFVIRFAGALADNMTAGSVLRIAEAVEILAESGRDIRFEIQTRPVWHEAQARRFHRLKHTRFQTEPLSATAYRQWLSAADAVVIAYNFDAASVSYIGLSMANKLPECLASGAPLIAHGPMDVATIAYLAAQDCALVIDHPDKNQVAQAIARLMDDPGLYERLAARGQGVAFSRHDIGDIRRRFAARLSEVAVSRRPRQGVPQAQSSEVSAYRSSIDWINNSHPKVRTLIEYVYRLLQVAGRHRGATVAVAALGIAIVFAAVFSPSPLNYVFWAIIALGAVAVVTLFAVGVATASLKRAFEELRAQDREREKALRRLTKSVAEQRVEMEQLSEDLAKRGDVDRPGKPPRS